jgi:hypothetical protein
MLKVLLIPIVFGFNIGELCVFLEVIGDLAGVGVDLAALRVKRRF